MALLRACLPVGVRGGALRWAQVARGEEPGKAVREPSPVSGEEEAAGWLSEEKWWAVKNIGRREAAPRLITANHGWLGGVVFRVPRLPVGERGGASGLLVQRKMLPYTTAGLQEKWAIASAAAGFSNCGRQVLLRGVFFSVSSMDCMTSVMAEIGIMDRAGWSWNLG